MAATVDSYTWDYLWLSPGEEAVYWFDCTGFEGYSLHMLAEPTTIDYAFPNTSVQVEVAEQRIEHRYDSDYKYHRFLWVRYRNPGSEGAIVYPTTILTSFPQ